MTHHHYPNLSFDHADDNHYMAHALQLAEHGVLTTTPNPRVGCVIVRDGQIVGSGWHHKAGEPHAEIHALREAGDRAHGATAYVTLEPCSHHGRTPPCADALIHAGIANVVVAMQDPNPLVAGRGLEKLAAAGINTTCGIMANHAAELNRGFIARMTRQRAWLTLKTGSSLDGRTALSNGSSQWITGTEARHDVQRLRARACAVMTGIGTILADDPQLNVRDVDTPRQPERIIIDSRLRTPDDAHILHNGGVVIVHTEAASTEQVERLTAKGATLLQVASINGQVNLQAALSQLTQRGYNDILCEAGATLQGALIAAGLADEWVAYFAPSLLGHAARGLFNLPTIAQLDDRIQLTVQSVQPIGSDWRITSRFNHPSST